MHLNKIFTTPKKRRVLTGPRSKLKNMSSSLPGIDFPNLALKEEPYHYDEEDNNDENNGDCDSDNNNNNHNNHDNNHNSDNNLYH